MRIKTTFAMVGLIVLLTASPTRPAPKFALANAGAKSPDNDSFYCVLLDESQNKRAFFAAVFSGDNSEQRTFETQFTAYVDGRYGGVIGTASCHFDKSRTVAIMRRDDEKAAASRENRAVIETKWRP